MRIRASVLALIIVVVATAQISYSQPLPDTPEGMPVTALNPGWVRVAPAADEKPRASRDSRQVQLDEEYRKNNPNWVRIDELELSKAGDLGGRLNPPKPYMYKVRIKNNNGSKAIIAVKWTYVFLDPVTRKELLRHSFDSKTKIAPGKEKEITIYTDAAPPSVVNARAKTEKGKEWLEEVIVERIEYADRTTWEKKSERR